MFLSEYEEKVVEWLKSLGIIEEFPYLENGILYTANTLEEIYFKATFSYETFEPVEETNKYYSANELHNIRLLLKYQKKMGAYYKNFHYKSTVTEEEVKALTHEQVKNRLNKAYRCNRGVYYITGLRGYTSTTLHENPIIEKGEGQSGHEGCGMYRKLRLFGKMALVLPETLRLFDGTTSIFEYPFLLKGKEVSSDSIYEVYVFAYKNPDSFELLNARRYYSSQEKRTIKKLCSLGRLENA